MKRQFLSFLMTASLVSASFCGAALTYAEEGVEVAEAIEDGALSEAPEAGEVIPEEPVFDGNIRVWVPEAVKDVTERRIEMFLESSPDYSAYTITVEAVGDDLSANMMLSDVAGGADLYVFSQDQLGRLAAGGALAPAEEASGWIRERNDEGSVNAASINDTIYAYPMTSDNGYLLFYDKSVLHDVSTVEGILADLEPTGKKFYMELTSGFYQPAFFFATGCDIAYETDAAGNFTGAVVTCASDFGLSALKAMISVADSSTFANGSSIADAENCAAIVAGIWDSAAAMEAFGDNFACAKLPTFSVGDLDYQMSGFGGFRLLGVKPQSNPERLPVIRALAQYLSGEEAQLERYETALWGPSNRFAQTNENVAQDLTFTAMAEQLKYSLPLGPYPSGYWTLTASLGENIVNGVYRGATDDELRAILEEVQTACLSYAG